MIVSVWYDGGFVKEKIYKYYKELKPAAFTLKMEMFYFISPDLYLCTF